MKIACMLLAVLALALASGCVTESAGITGSTIPLEPGGYQTMGQVEGTSWGVWFLIIPLTQASTRDAMLEAQDAKRGEALINVTVDNTTYFPPLFYLKRIRVEGTAVRMQPKMMTP